MSIRAAWVAVACLMMCATVLAQAPAPATPRPPSPPAKVAEAAWLVGYWVGEGLGGYVDEVWMPAKDGVMLGAFRLVKADGKGFTELFAIEEWEGSLRLVVKHFNPDWVGWEEKDQALKLRLTRLAPGELTFGGVVLRREGDDGLRVDLTLRMKDGTAKHERLDYKRRPL